MILAFAAFQPWLVALGLFVVVIGFGGSAAAIAYLRRGSHHLTTTLSLAIVVMLGVPLGLIAAYGILYGLDLGDSIGR